MNSLRRSTSAELDAQPFVTADRGNLPQHFILPSTRSKWDYQQKDCIDWRAVDGLKRHAVFVDSQSPNKSVG